MELSPLLLLRCLEESFKSRRIKMEMEQLVAGFFWGMVAMGFFMYAKSQRDAGALIVGVVMTALTYFLDTAVAISAAEVFTILVFYFYKKNS
jgi:hypothetical protein